MWQCWQVSVLIWSIELSISYVSLRSDNITNVKISYVLANLIESLKITTFLQAIVPTLVSLAIATQTLSLMRNSNWLWNLKLFQVTCQLNYTWNSVINQVEFWRLCNFQARNTNQVDPCMPNQCIKGNFDTLINDRSYWKIKKSNFQHKFWSPYIISIWTWLIFIDSFFVCKIKS